MPKNDGNKGKIQKQNTEQIKKTKKIRNKCNKMLKSDKNATKCKLFNKILQISINL